MNKQIDTSTLTPCIYDQKSKYKKALLGLRKINEKGSHVQGIVIKIKEEIFMTVENLKEKHKKRRDLLLHVVNGLKSKELVLSSYFWLIESKYFVFQKKQIKNIKNKIVKANNTLISDNSQVLHKKTDKIKIDFTRKCNSLNLRIELIRSQILDLVFKISQIVGKEYNKYAHTDIISKQKYNVRLYQKKIKLQFRISAIIKERLTILYNV